MENKEEIVARLKLLLMATRAGSNIQDLKLNEAKNKVTIVFKAGGERVVDIIGDSGYAIIIALYINTLEVEQEVPVQYPLLNHMIKAMRKA